MVDLTLVPSYHYLVIPRMEDGWHLQIDLGGKGDLIESRDWNESSFVDAVNWLSEKA